MTFVIAEPCIGVKDTACVDACPVDCIHSKKNTTHDDGRPTFHSVPSSTLIPWNASTAAPAFPSAQSLRFSHRMICPRNGSTLRKSMPAMSRAANSRPTSSPSTKRRSRSQETRAESASLRSFFGGSFLRVPHDKLTPARKRLLCLR